ncbi:tetratricopeptide repeat protein 39B [Parasteatoda tepidariorum]|uniref:tetratricopeptide repeat protein 39B n=1 Tax=Parasteatoda tepidariorum TaxID=114398 RepID=UPI00077FD968|nr:tetratricopeptide repeat protein 39B isoform X2 [Parasteatoda tepidariorum]
MAGSESEEEAYEDALDGLHIDGLPSLDESIKEAKLSLDLFFQNKFAAALDSLMSWSHISTYHALGKGTMLFMQALLTMESKEIEKAAEALRQAVDVCQRKRKKHTMSKMLRRPDYNLYTEEEVHAELCYAECLLLTAVLTFVEDQSLVNFVRGSLRIRTCYHSYKECMHILETRKWSNELRKKHFESGVRMGVGTFNLMISQLPSKVLKLLEFIGFSGNRQLGLKELDEGYAMKESLRSPLCALILVTFHTLVTYMFGCGDGDIETSERIVQEMLFRYPEAALFIFLSGRIKMLKGQINEAIDTYQLSINVQQEWKQFHYLCYWELLWCHCFKCDWKEAAKCSDILRLECKWSPAVYTYVHASILFMMVEEGNTELQGTISELMEKVPSLKQRLAGKSIPLEKYVVRKSVKFVSQKGRLIVPALELVYIWNSFPMIAKSRELTENILCKINNIFSSLGDAKDIADAPLDDYCLILLLRGVCYTNLGRINQAEDCFREVIACEKRVKDDMYLIPFTMTELALIKLKQGDGVTAKELLEPARHNYRGYPLETILHFRVHSILRQLRAKGHVIPTPSPKSTPLHSPDPSPNRNGEIPEFPYLRESPTMQPKRNLLHPPADLGSCVSLP